MLAVARPTKERLHSTEFSDGEYMEQLSLSAFSQTHVACLTFTHLPISTGFSSETLRTGHSACHFDTSIIYLVYGRHSCCTYLLSLLGTQQEKKTTTTVLRPSVRDYPGEPVSAETFTHSPVLIINHLNVSSIYYNPQTMIQQEENKNKTCQGRWRGEDTEWLFITSAST